MFFKFKIKLLLNLLFSLIVIFKNKFNLKYVIDIKDKIFLINMNIFLVYSCLDLFINSIIKFIHFLIIAAFFTLIERRVMGFLQRRKGPNVVGVFGLLQPIADGVKLIFKEIIIPSKVNLILFFISPIIVFVLILLNILLIPLNFLSINIDLNILLLLLILSISTYGILLSGWSSNSKYAFLGSMRSLSQFISYELILTFIILIFSLENNTLNLYYIKSSKYLIIINLIIIIIFFVSILAESNRTPFDLPEGESELVAGFNTEYSGFPFSLFFLGEYTNLIISSSLIIYFIFGYIYIFGVLFVMYLIVLIRGTLPRIKYNDLININWSFFLPFLTVFYIFISNYIFINNLSIYNTYVYNNIYNIFIYS